MALALVIKISEGKIKTKLKSTGPSRKILATVRCVEVHLPDTYTSYAQLVGWVGAALGPNTHSHT